ncbi:MAG: flagellar accessory protein FlaH [Dehalococcoidia bacterium]|nr:flagellar accessory protein FlaH [Dehalococcoidia bacterium]MDW8120117.1 ATPase domain-containing protein [Chloroflexota bacterium]
MAPTALKGQRIISTGNPEIDKKLGGGIPTGSLVLVEGQSDSGKSVLIQQMLWGSLKGGFTVTLLTTENTVKSLVRQMQSLNQDVTDYLLLGKLKVYPIKAMQGKIRWERTLQDLLTALRAQRKRDLVAIDSITSFVVHSAPEEVIAFFEECKSICNDGTSIVVAAHSHAFSESLLVRISSLCDAHLHLGIENLGERVVRVLVASKVRGAEQTTGNIISFDVEPGWGMRIIPFTKAKA